MTTSTLPASGRTSVAALMILLLTFGWTLIAVSAALADEDTETTESAEGQDPDDDEPVQDDELAEAESDQDEAPDTADAEGTDTADDETTESRAAGAATAGGDAEADDGDEVEAAGGDEAAVADTADEPEDADASDTVEEDSFTAQSEHEDPAQLQEAEFADAGDAQTFGDTEGDTLSLTFDGELSGVAEGADGQVTVSGEDGDDINLQESEALEFEVEGATLTLTVTAPGNVTDVEDILERVVTIVDEVYDTNDLEVVVPDGGIEIVVRASDDTDGLDALRGELEDTVRELFGDDVADALSDTIATLEASEEVLQGLLDSAEDGPAGFVAELLDAGFDGLVEELVGVLAEAGAIDELVEILVEVLDAGLVAELLPVLDELVEQLIETEAFDDLRFLVEALLDEELMDELLDVLVLVEEHGVLAELGELFPRIFTVLIEAGLLDEVTSLLVSISDAEIDVDVVVILDGLLADLEAALDAGDITEEDARRFLQALLEDELLGAELERRIAEGELSVTLAALLETDEDAPDPDAPDPDAPDPDAPDLDAPDPDAPDPDRPDSEGPDEDRDADEVGVVTRSPGDTTGVVSSGASAPGTLPRTGAATADLALGGLVALLLGGVALRLKPRSAPLDLDG
jgi:hypothetical protein